MSNKNKASDNQVPLLRDLYVAKQQMDEAKAHFDSLRKDVVSMFMEEVTPGTVKVNIEDKMMMSISVSKTIDIDKDMLYNQLSELERKGLVGEGKLITMKPSVSVSGYNHLSAEDRAQFGEMFTVKSGSPQIKFEHLKD